MSRFEGTNSTPARDAIARPALPAGGVTPPVRVHPLDVRRQLGFASGALRISIACVLLLCAITLLAHDSKPEPSRVVWETMAMSSSTSVTSLPAAQNETVYLQVSEQDSAKRLAPSAAEDSLTLPATGLTAVLPARNFVDDAELADSVKPSDAVSLIDSGSSLQVTSRTWLNVAPVTGSDQTARPLQHSSAAAAILSSQSRSAPLPAAYRAAPAKVSVIPLGLTLAPHPRLLLDPSTLAVLGQRAASDTSAWKLLKATCDSYIGGTVGYPTGNAYPDRPNLGSGYQGESYLPALLAEGMCYQVLKSSNAAAAKPYGAKALDILMKMSAPYPGSNGWNPCTDDGYGIRFYGVGYGLGYDWLYDLLTSAQREQVYTAANAWLAAWEKPKGCADFEYAHPQSNYFAGYFHAKAVIALATYDENPEAPAQWSDWLGNQFGARVQPYYQKHLLGGGWPEGFGNYASLGILNMSLPAREVKSATGMDLIHASAPYTFPLASADYAMHFAWPSRAYFDDRDTNHSTGNSAHPPGTSPVGMFEHILGDLIYWNSPKVAVFHQYLNEVAAATDGFSPADAWQIFLSTDPGTPVAPLKTLPLSYFAPGLNAVAARSDWDKGASWMSFRAGPYVNNPAQGEEYFDQGGLALVRGDAPLLINTGGWMVHEPNGTQAGNDVYADNYGSFNGSVYLGNRQLYNVFYVRNMSGSAVVDRYGQAAYTGEENQVRTGVSAYEDGGRYVYVRATRLEDMYRKFPAGPGVAEWSREIVYLRPNRFVVFDRTAKGNANYDQFLAWHFPASPVTLAAPAGQNRLGVTYKNKFVGAMTTVLPASNKLTTIPLYPGSNPVKAWQVQERPANSSLNQIWLTVFDLSSSASGLASASSVVVKSGGIAGVQLLASDGNAAVISSTGPAGAPLTVDVAYEVSSVGSEQIVTDLLPNTGYSASVALNGNTQGITISKGGALMSSAKGVLAFYVTSAGVVQAGSPAKASPPYPSVPVSLIPVVGSPKPYKP